MRRLQCVAVRAQDAEILETVVVFVPVDVIELDRNHAITVAARGPAAALT